MKIKVSRTAPFWRILILLAWVVIVALCTIHGLNDVFHTSDMLQILRGYFVLPYILIVILTTVFTFFTTVFLAKGLLTWLDR